VWKLGEATVAHFVGLDAADENLDFDILAPPVLGYTSREELVRVESQHRWITKELPQCIEASWASNNREHARLNRQHVRISPPAKGTQATDGFEGHWR
jgi:hypothetical protein